MKISALSTCMILCLCSSVFSQSSNFPFQEIDESVLTNASVIPVRSITPKSYETLLLNEVRLRQILDGAPKEDSDKTTTSDPLEIRMSDGEVHAFHIIEYSMMEPGLAAKFPTFKTYYGYGVDNPRLRIRLDWTSNGLNVMMELPQGRAIIRPYAQGDTEHYLSYYEKDVEKEQSPFVCGTVHDKVVENKNKEESRYAGDCQLRTYRLAIAVTGEYATNTLGASSAGNAADDDIVTAHVVTSINQINEWYERDVSARFILIANLTDVFYYDGATDPYSNGNGVTMLGENITNMNATLGSANYDIGHVLGNSGGSGGVAGLGVLCAADKARGVTQASAAGITQPRFLKVWAHEMGHQFGAGHTQGEQCQRSSTSAMEPGAGTTLMSYVTSACANQIQNVPDYYFHAISIQQMSSTMLNTNCADILPNGNSAPTVDALSAVSVPSSTPLFLDAVANDIDNDPLTFTWEQYNNELAEEIPPESTNTQGPSFRSLPPSLESRRYLPSLDAVINGTTPTWEVLPSVARTMDFRVTVRDNSTNGISCTVEEDIEITTVATGPFLVTSPTTSGVIWVEGQTIAVTWDVAGTDVAPVSCANVDILLSYDGGFTYPVSLANGVANNGTADIVVPVGITTTARVQVRCSDNIFYNISANDFEIQVGNEPTFTTNLPNPLSTICAGDTESNIQLNSSSILGFTGNITLSAANLPGSSTVTFDDPVIVAGSATTFEISNTSGIAAGDYTITVTGTSGSIIRNINYILTVREEAGTTVLTMPDNNALDTDIIPLFTWEEKPNATSYNIQVSLNPSFANLELNETTSNSSFSADGSLAGSTLHYWRVKATTTCGDTPWSMTREFTTEDCGASYAENTVVPISPNGTPVINSILTIDDQGTIDGLEVSDIIGTHTYVSDLTFTLIAPGGNPSVVLAGGLCGFSDDFNLSFSDDATDPVASAPCSPLGQGGTFIPSNPLSVFDGLSITGDWTLRIEDAFNLDGGDLLSWKLDFCALDPSVSPSAIYVDIRAAGANNGQSWADAHENLQDALAAARINGADTIKIAGGTYHPDIGASQALGFRSHVFQIDFETVLEGGYNPATGQKDQLYPTYLSGNIGSLDSKTDNSHQVLQVTESATLSNFTVEDAYGTSDLLFQGAGIFATGGTFKNLTIRHNEVTVPGGRGAGMYITGEAVVMENLLIYENNALFNGGGIAFENVAGDNTLNNVTIADNTAIESSNGGLYIQNSSVDIFNTIVYNNTPASITIPTGSSFSALHSIIDSPVSWPGTANSNMDPTFVDRQHDNYRISECDIANNSGDSNYAPFSGIDLDGNPRIKQGTVDIGAYEVQRSELRMQLEPIVDNSVNYSCARELGFIIENTQENVNYEISGFGLQGSIIGNGNDMLFESTNDVQEATYTLSASRNVGKALSFSANKYIEIPYEQELAVDISKGFTIQTVFTANNVTGTKRIYSQEGSFGFGLNGNNILFTTFGNTDYIFTNTTIAAGVQYNVRIESFPIGSNQVRYFVYIDDALQETQVGNMNQNTNTNDINVGGRPSNEWLDGSIDFIEVKKGNKITLRYDFTTGGNSTTVYDYRFLKDGENPRNGTMIGHDPTTDWISGTDMIGNRCPETASVDVELSSIPLNHTVTLIENTGFGSLRYLTENSCPNDTIRFNSSTDIITYPINSPIMVNHNLNFIGTGVNTTIWDGNGQSGFLFDIPTSAKILMRDLQVTNIAGGVGAFTISSDHTLENLLLKGYVSPSLPAFNIEESSVLKLKGIVEIKD